MSMVARVIENANRMPSQEALQAPGSTFTYRELADVASAVAGWLRSRDVGQGARVALRLPNCPLYVAVVLGAWQVGAVVVPVSTRISADEVSHVLSDAEPALVLTTSDLVTTDDHPTVILHGDEDAASACSVFDSHPLENPVEYQPGAPALVVYTSGTTGRPKGAVLSHGSIEFCTTAKARHTGMDRESRVLLFLPLYHCYGLNAVLGPALTVGATVFLLPSFEKQRVLEAIYHESITHFFAVPSVFRLLIDAATPPKVLQSVRRCVSAGAPLPVVTQEEWTAEFGMPIDVAYGLTETSPFATYDRAASRIGSVGKPVDGVKVKVVGDDGIEVAPETIGEIAIKGPNVMLGYWRKPEETAAAIRDGWFRTGDLGRLSDDGYVYLVDRANDMMIFDGQNVYPSEVERVLTEHPAISEAVAYGTPHPLVGDLVRAVVVLQPGAAVTETDLQVLCAERLAAYKVPRTIRFAEQIPRNATGKPLRRELAQAHDVPSERRRSAS